MRRARGRRRGAPGLAAGARGLRRRRLQEAQHRAHRAAAVRRQPPQGATEVTEFASQHLSLKVVCKLICSIH